MGSCAPKTEIVCVVGVVPGNWSVISLGDNLLASFPNDPFDSVVHVLRQVPAETYCVINFRSYDFPRVAVLEPVVRDLDLFSVLNQLLKDTVVVSYAVAPSWDLESGKTVQEASSEPA